MNVVNFIKYSTNGMFFLDVWMEINAYKMKILVCDKPRITWECDMGCHIPRVGISAGAPTEGGESRIPYEWNMITPYHIPM